jgi:DNA-binding NarL/FixJ family response regulator
MTRILLADHHAQALWALKIALQEQPDVKVVAEAMDAENLLNLAQTHQPELVLLDKDLPGSSTSEIITVLHQFIPVPVVIVMSSDPANGRSALKAGADAFISKGEEPEWLLQSLQKLLKASPKKEGVKETTVDNNNPAINS